MAAVPGTSLRSTTTSCINRHNNTSTSVIYIVIYSRLLRD
jgi:hypothetical protein